MIITRDESKEGSANSGTGTKSSPLPASVYEFTLEQSHAHSFTDCLGLLSSYKVTVE